MTDSNLNQFYAKLPDASSENELASRLRKLEEPEKLNEVLEAIKNVNILPSMLRVIKKVSLKKPSKLKISDSLLDKVELRNSKLIVQSMIQILGAKNTLSLMKNRTHTKTKAIVNSWYYLSGYISNEGNPKYIVLLDQVFEAINNNYHNLSSEDKAYWDGLVKNMRNVIH